MNIAGIITRAAPMPAPMNQPFLAPPAKMTTIPIRKTIIVPEKCFSSAISPQAMPTTIVGMNIP